MCAAVALDLTDVEEAGVVEDRQLQNEGQAIGHEEAEAEAEAEAGEVVAENNVADSVVATDNTEEAAETVAEQHAATTQATSTFEHDLLLQIRDQESRVSTAEYQLNRAKEEVKECRESFDEEVSAMRRLIRQREEKHPLFDSQPVTSQTSEVVEGVEADANATASPTAKPADDDNSWRDTPIESLSIAESLVAKLMEANIETIGQLADYSASGGPLTGIKGIGAAKATKIEEAMDSFWKDQRTKACETIPVDSEKEEAKASETTATEESTEKPAWQA